MKRFLTAIVALWSLATMAGLPPTTLGGQAGAAATTFNFKVPNSQATPISGGGLIETGNMNVLPDPGAEGITTAWTAYANTSASATPTPAARGGAVSHLSVNYSATSPLYGSKSLAIINAGGTSAQGEGAYIPFTINNGGKGKVFSISFDYGIPSGPGTYTDDQVAFWIWDVTNSTLIQPSSYLLKNHNLTSDRAFLEFQASSSSTSYQLIAHVAGTATAAWTLKLDNFDVSSGKKTYGSPVTDWVSYTPALTAFGATSGKNIQYRRVGSTLEVKGFFTSGTPTTATTHIELPSGLTISSSINSPQLVGHANRSNTANTANGFTVLANASSTTISFGVQSVSGNNPLAAAAANGIIANADTVSFEFAVPIQGWASTVQMSDQSDSRLVDFVGYIASNTTLTASVTDLPLTTVKDTHNGWSSTQYTVKVPGDYFVSGFSFSTGTAGTFKVYVNGVQTTYLHAISSSGGSGSTILENLKAGDTISLRSDTGLTIVGATLNRYSISKIQAPTQIAASETVAAAYYLSANQTISASGVVNMDTKIYDTHGAVTTGSGWKFTAPVSGLYTITGFAYNTTAGSNFYIYVNGAGTGKTQMIFFQNTGVPQGGSVEIMLLAGEYIQLIGGAAGTLQGGAPSGGYAARLFIKRAGSYN